MWIEVNQLSTRRVTVKEMDDDGNMVANHAADFNHNGRAKVSDKAGKFLMGAISALKKVQDGGPPPPKEEPAEAVTEKESTDG